MGRSVGKLIGPGHIATGQYVFVIGHAQIGIGFYCAIWVKLDAQLFQPQAIGVGSTAHCH